MLMVVFGAGASYDSFPSGLPNSTDWEDRRPPLANELFDNRPAFGPVVSRFPRCQPIISRLRHRGAFVPPQLEMENSVPPLS